MVLMIVLSDLVCVLVVVNSLFVMNVVVMSVCLGRWLVGFVIVVGFFFGLLVVCLLLVGDFE